MKVLPIFTLVTSVLAHGGIYFYTIDGLDYEGYWNLGPLYPVNPPMSGNPSIQRRWRETPIYPAGFLGPNMTCNHDGASTSPSAHAPIKAGATIKATWHSKNSPYYSWVHNTGPMLVYMARCPGTSCEGFDGGGAVWFKIQQLGLKPGATGIGGGNWMQDQILSTQIFNSSDPHPVVSWSPSGLETVIPKTLKPGAYLIRHEIFNYGVLPKQPQSFPNCAQLMVQGDGTKSPSQEYLVSFPGAYKLDDPAWDIAGAPSSQQNITKIIFPGPKVWTGDE